MMFGRSLVLFATGFVLVAVLSGAIGLNAGAKATTASEATASFDGQTFTVVGDSTDVEYSGDRARQPGPVASWLYANTPLDGQTENDGPLNDAVTAFVNTMLRVAFHLAAVAAHIGAKVGFYAPNPVVPALSYGLKIVGFGAVLLHIAFELQRVRRHLPV